MAAETWRKFLGYSSFITKVLGYSSSITKVFRYSSSITKAFCPKAMGRLTDIAVIYTTYQAGMEVYNLSLVAKEERSFGIFLQRAVLHYEIANFHDLRVMEDVVRRKRAKEILEAERKRKEAEKQAKELADLEAKRKEEEKKAKELADLEAKMKEEEKEAKKLADLDAKTKEDGKKKNDE